MPKTKPKKKRGRDFDEYKPVKNHINKNASFDGCMFETYGSELKHVYKIGKKTEWRNVWTIIDGDSGDLYTIAGFHFVNRIGYLITEDPWESDTIEFDKEDRRIND